MNSKQQDLNREYHKYLQSSEWRMRAEKRLRIDHYQCQACGSVGVPGNELEVHHWTYRNIFHENPETDLVTLCRCCHKLIHNAMNRVTDLKSGRHGWKDVPNVPKRVSVVNINGYNYEYFDEP